MPRRRNQYFPQRRRPMMPGAGDLLMDMFPDVAQNYIPGDLTWAARDYGFGNIANMLAQQTAAQDQRVKWQDQLAHRNLDRDHALRVARGGFIQRDKDRELERQGKQADLDRQTDIFGRAGRQFQQKLAAETGAAKAKTKFDWGKTQYVQGQKTKRTKLKTRSDWERLMRSETLKDQRAAQRAARETAKQSAKDRKDYIRMRETYISHRARDPYTRQWKAELAQAAAHEFEAQFGPMPPGETKNIFGPRNPQAPKQKTPQTILSEVNRIAGNVFGGGKQKVEHIAQAAQDHPEWPKFLETYGGNVALAAQHFAQWAKHYAVAK